MTERQFWALLEVAACDLPICEDAADELVSYINSVCRRRGYQDWLDARESVESHGRFLAAQELRKGMRESA
jgi:hypothetical protein